MVDPFRVHHFLCLAPLAPHLTVMAVVVLLPMGCHPLGMRAWRTVPMAGNPDIVARSSVPESPHPNIVRAWAIALDDNLMPKGRGRGINVNVDRELGKHRRRRQRGCRQYSQCNEPEPAGQPKNGTRGVYFVMSMGLHSRTRLLRHRLVPCHPGDEAAEAFGAQKSPASAATLASPWSRYSPYLQIELPASTPENAIRLGATPSCPTIDLSD